MIIFVSYQLSPLYQAVKGNLIHLPHEGTDSLGAAEGIAQDAIDNAGSHDITDYGPMLDYLKPNSSDFNLWWNHSSRSLAPEIMLIYTIYEYAGTRVVDVQEMEV